MSSLSNDTNCLTDMLLAGEHLKNIRRLTALAYPLYHEI